MNVVMASYGSMGPKQEIRPVVGTHGIEILIASVQNMVAERDADRARGFDNVSDQ